MSVYRPTIYDALTEKLGRSPSYDEVKIEVKRILNEQLIESATAGKLALQTGVLPMSPSDLADRLKRLDWSATSLQHQLAISCAVETLAKQADPIKLASERHSCSYTVNAVIGWKCECGKPRPALPVTGNVVALHPSRTLRTVTLYRLSPPYSLFATAGFLPGDAGAPWAWIVEQVALEWGVADDAVGCAEGPDGEDLVTVNGLPVLRVAIGSQQGGPVSK